MRTPPCGDSGPADDDVAGLLFAVSARDERAFDTLYRLCAPRVHALVRRVVIDEQLSVEVSQEVFFSLWQEMAARYDPSKGSGISWVLTLAHRKAVDKVRLEENHRARNLAYGTKNLEVDFDSVSEAVLGRWEADQLRRHLRTLTAAQRQAICLAYYGAMTYREVAEHLEIPVPTAKTRIRDGLKRLALGLAADAVPRASGRRRAARSSNTTEPAGPAS